MTTLAELALEVARKVTSVIEGTATSGDGASLTDILGLQDPTGNWNKGTLWLLGGVHSGKMTTVTTYADNKLNFRSLGAPICVQQSQTYVVSGLITGSGDIGLTLVAASMNGSPKSISVAVVAPDDATTIATKIRAALNADADIAAFFTVSGDGTANVIIACIYAAVNDATLLMTWDDDTSVGVDPSPAPSNVVAGVAGPKYALARQDVPLAQIVSGINSALSEVTITGENYALIGDGETLEFTLPNGVGNVYKIEFERPGFPTRRQSNHWDELNGKVRFDNGYPPLDDDVIHLFYEIKHASLVNYNDTLDDEVREDWLVQQAIFNVLMWAKTIFGDDEDFDIPTKLQVCTALLANLSPRKRTHIRVRSAGTRD